MEKNAIRIVGVVVISVLASLFNTLAIYFVVALISETEEYGFWVIVCLMTLILIYNELTKQPEQE